MITVHHLEASRSQRIIWLLEELGGAYEVRTYKRDTNMLAPEELRAIHPLGKSPVVVDGDAVLAESGAIIETLIDRYGAKATLRPTAEAQLILYRYWLHFAEGTAMPNLLMKLVFSTLATKSPFLIRPLMKAVSAKVHALLIAPNFEANFGLIETHLGKSAWFAGDTFSAADIQMSYPLEAVEARFGYCSGPNMQRYLDSIRRRPAYQRAVDKVGPCFPAS